MGWWHQNHHRLIQNNIRETDAALNVDLLVRQLKDFRANVLMLNTGGITAFYPTKLRYQTRSPYLKGDLIGEVVEKCHQNGIRMIARFDFSKVQERLLEEKPEWLYLSRGGERIRHEGLVSTCICGGYQQEYIYEILGEVLRRYPVDGIFFNMFGFVTSDYSGHDYGICHCESCRRRFFEETGLALPKDSADPAYPVYLLFQKKTVRRMLDRIHAFVKGISPEIAISTYAEHKVDMVRKESNTELSRPLPFWLYSASENVQSVGDCFADKVISNCSINAAGIDYRFMGVSKHQAAVRLYESLAAGSALDFCIIGPFEGYPDRANFDTMREIYRFHSENEGYFGNYQPLSRAALLKPERFASKEREEEYLGFYKLLKEAHVLFDVLGQETLAAQTLTRYSLLLVPDIRAFSQEDCGRFEALARAGTSVLASGEAFAGNPEGLALRRTLFGVVKEAPCESLRGAYFLTEDKSVFSHFKDRDWVLLDGGFSPLTFDETARGLLPLLSAGVYGPPEKVGGNIRTDRFGAAVTKKDGAANCLLPWGIGRLYYRFGYEDHKNLLLDLVFNALAFSQDFSTDLPADVELTLNRLKNGAGQGRKDVILQLINLSGFNGVTFLPPHEVRDIPFTLRGPYRGARSLVSGRALPARRADGALTVTIKSLGQYEAIVFDGGQ